MTRSETFPAVREVGSYLRRTFADKAGVAESELFTADATLATVISRSPRMTNSIDLMEAFAKTAKAVQTDYGIRVRLPALPLDTPLESVIDAFLAEVDRQRAGAA
jgi:hypothetical protein